MVTKKASAAAASESSASFIAGKQGRQLRSGRQTVGDNSKLVKPPAALTSRQQVCSAS